MRYIDTHLHFWNLENEINSWVLQSKNNPLIRNFELTDYLQEYPLPYGLITIEAADSYKTIDEINWLKRNIVNSFLEKEEFVSKPITHLSRQPVPKIQVKHIAHIDVLQEPERFNIALKQFSHYDFVIGFRHILSHSSASSYSPSTEDITLDKFKLYNLRQNLVSLKNHNYVFDCQMYPDQLLRILGTIQETGALCVVDHCGLPLLTTAANKTFWLNMLDEFKKSGVFFKLSGFDLNSNILNLNIILEQILDIIPDDRLMFGSNYPLSLGIDLIQSIEKFLDITGLAFLKERIFFENAYNFFFNRKINLLKPRNHF